MTNISEHWGANILAGIFSKKPVHGLYDIPSIMLYHWLVNRELYIEYDKTHPGKSCIYGDFVFHHTIENFILAHYSTDHYVDMSEKEAKEVFKTEVGYFRKRIGKEIMLDAAYDEYTHNERIVTLDSVSKLNKTIAENKIWNDKIISEVRPAFMQFLIGMDPGWDGENNSSKVIGKIGEVNIHDEDDFTKAEREAWISNMHADYVKYAEKINLKMLKEICTDELGRPFQPQGRQKEFLVEMRRYNFVSASRRAGKTKLSAYLAARQMYIPNQNIIYVVPEIRNHGRTPWKYLLDMLGKDPNVRFDKSNWSIYNRSTKSEIFFMSGSRENSVRGSAANLLIFDEAAYLSETVFESASALVRTTNGIVYAITTPNIDTPKNWYYYKLIEAELSKYDKESPSFGKRITLRENPFIPDKEKELIAKEGQTNMRIFNCEYMAQFHDGEEFDLSRFWTVDYKPVEYNIAGQRLTQFRYSALEKEKSVCPYNHYIISYDCAKKMDRPGIGVIGLHEDGGDVVLADYMPNFDYVDQVKNVIALRDVLGKHNCTIVLDYGQAGIVVEELFRREHKIDVNPVLSTGGRTPKRVGGVWNVPKEVMLAKFKSAISRGVLKGFSFMDKLRLEFETYDREQSRSYGHHYDIMMALVQAVWFADRYGRMQVEKKTTKEKSTQWQADALSEDHDYFGVMYQEDEDLVEDRYTRYGY